MKDVPPVRAAGVGARLRLGALSALVVGASILGGFAYLRPTQLDLMPHGMCYLWNPALLWTNAGADAIIGISYAAITFGLVSFLLRNAWNVPFNWMVVAFATFILACGTGHFMEVVTLWSPVYWLSSGVKLLTAAASSYTAVALPSGLSRVNRIVREARNAEAYRAEAVRVNAELARRTIERAEELARANAALEARIAERTAEVDELNVVLAARLRELEAAYAILEGDAAERARVACQLEHLAHHDPITALPNRILLMEQLQSALTTARRAQTEVLVLYLDLDRFKPVNDELGHSAGDRVLAEVGGRIGSCMRAGDTASRVGGDEFVVVCASTEHGSDGPAIATRLIAAIGEPIVLDEIALTLGVSIGISVSPDHGDDPEQLIMNADVAMYRAKQSGRNCFRVYAREFGVARTAGSQRLPTAGRDGR